MERIVSSFYISEPIVKFSMEVVDSPRLIGSIVFDPSKNCIVGKVNREVYFDLNSHQVTTFTRTNKTKIIYVSIPEENVSEAYQISISGDVTKISHLYIETISGKIVFLENEQPESYLNIIKNIPHEYVKDLYINYDGVFMPYFQLVWTLAAKNDEKPTV